MPVDWLSEIKVKPLPCFRGVVFLYRIIRLNLQYLPRNPGTSFGIGKCMVMILQIVSAESRNGIQPMVGCIGEDASGSHAGAVELIVGVVHTIEAEDGLQTRFVECLVVRHKR